MKLIGSGTSPYVRKVRIALAEKKLDYEFVTENPWAADSTLSRQNPLGQVPCLVLSKPAMAMYDSRVIVEYLDTLSPVCRLIPADGRERLEVKIWEALADGLLDAGIRARMENHWEGRAPGQRSQAWVDRQLGKVKAALAEMARMLEDKPFCAGKQFSLADVATGTALGWLDFRFPEIAWRQAYPELAELDSRLMERASFAETVPQA